MKKIILAVTLMTVLCINTYGQDASNLKSKKLPPNKTNYGPYTVTNDDGKVTVTKNANYNASKALKRDTSRQHKSIVEIYTANSTTPTITKHLIYDANSLSSEHLMSKQERMAKYHSRDGVLIVHLKPGIILINEIDLLNKFNISQKNYSLPVYVDYKAIKQPDGLLAISDAVLKIKTVTDADGFQFLNITTKEWDIERQKYAKEGVIQLK
jgi:hypothetical protein